MQAVKQLLHLSSLNRHRSRNSAKKRLMDSFLTRWLFFLRLCEPDIWCFNYSCLRTFPQNLHSDSYSYLTTKPVFNIQIITADLSWRFLLLKRKFFLPVVSKGSSYCWGFSLEYCKDSVLSIFRGQSGVKKFLKTDTDMHLLQSFERFL